MTCPICRYETEDGKYCKKCGARLITRDTSVIANLPVQGAAPHTYHVRQNVSNRGERPQVNGGEAALPMYTPPDIPVLTASRQYSEESVKANPYWTSLKLYGQLYGDYFLKGLRHPFRAAAAIEKSQFLYAIVSMMLYVLVLPLAMYAATQHEWGGVSQGTFVDHFLKPVMSISIFVILLNLFIFAAIKLSFNPAVKLKEVMTRFGSMLSVFIVLYMVSFLCLIVNGDISKMIILLTFICTVMTVPLFVMTSYKRRVSGGLDPLYAILLVYAASMLVLSLMGSSVIESIIAPL